MDLPNSLICHLHDNLKSLNNMLVRGLINYKPFSPTVWQRSVWREVCWYEMVWK